jgi:hypothetical protein
MSTKYCEHVEMERRIGECQPSTVNMWRWKADLQEGGPYLTLMGAQVVESITEVRE